MTFPVAEVLLKQFGHTLTYIRPTKWSFVVNSRIYYLFQKCSDTEFLDVTSYFNYSNLLIIGISSLKLTDKSGTFKLF